MKRAFVVVLLILLTVNSYSDIYPGRINELLLKNKIDNTSHYVSPDNTYEYIVSNNRLLLNVKSYDINEIIVEDSSISSSSLKFKVLPPPLKWVVSDSYLNNSGTYDLHINKANLPTCRVGNICTIDNNFSIFFNEKYIPEKVKLYINNVDITTLFYYDTPNNQFKIKEYHGEKLLSHFKTDIATLSWKLGTTKKYNGSVKIFLARNTIKGQIQDTAGKFLTELSGRRVVFNYIGSDTLAPHSLYTYVDFNGEYSISGLPTLDYNIVFDLFPGIMPEFTDYIIENKNKTLSIKHILPYFDKFLSLEADSIKAGQLVNVPLDRIGAETITKIEQISGDNVEYSTSEKGFTFISPVTNDTGEEIVFLGYSDDRRFIISFPNIVEKNEGYTQFGLFSKGGVYAKTKISGIDDEIFTPDKDITISVDSIYSIDHDNVKAHYYYKDGKAVDVTEFFKWNAREQVLELKNKADFYSLLDVDGVLTGTFCRQTAQECYRIKRNIRPGKADVFVDLSENSIPDSAYIIIRELEVRDNPIIKITKALGISPFEAIPEGVYQIMLADLDLNIYGSSFLEINQTSENNITIKIEIHENQGKEVLFLNSPNLIKLSEQSIYINSEDSVILDLKNLGLTTRIDNLAVLGDFPGHYELYQDNNFMMVSRGEYRSSEITFIFTSQNISYLLPVRYIGDDYVMVTENGMDYHMCPDERPYCINAFLQIFGVQQRIYNGVKPFVILFPTDFKKEGMKVKMANQDITEMFVVNPDKRAVTLRNSQVPGFLSILSSSTGNAEMTVDVNNTTYYISLIPGYKEITVGISDPSGDAADRELNAKLSCHYGNNYFSQISSIENGMTSFTNLPDCTYSLELLDFKRQFRGKNDSIVLRAGMKGLRVPLLVECITPGTCGSMYEQLQESVITPTLVKLFTPIPEGAIIEINPKNAISLRVDVDGILIFDSALTETARIITINDTMYNYQAVPYKRDLVMQTESDNVSVSSITGIDDDMIFMGEPFNIGFKVNKQYKTQEISATLVNGSKHKDVTKMFYWDESRQKIYLKRAESNNFLNELQTEQSNLHISIGEGFALIINISAGVTDLEGVVVNDYVGENRSISPQVLLYDKGGRYKASTSIAKNGTFRFSNVPSGWYELVVFDMKGRLYGKRELEIQEIGAELFIEVPVKHIAQEYINIQGQPSPQGQSSAQE